MKTLDNMTFAEMEAEIKAFEAEKFDQEENYVFISYSHKDKEFVARTVLGWIRNGYNVYIDYDFENHGSDDNWVNIMDGKIGSSNCVMVVCFLSEDYYFSYAALIELLTMRSKTMIEYRDSAENDQVPIDILLVDKRDEKGNPVKIVKSKADFSTKEVKQRYKEEFKKLQENMGKVFMKSKTEERKQMISGFSSLYDEEAEIEKNMQYLEKAYSSGSGDFYKKIANYMIAWFDKWNLNGNQKSSLEGVIHRFKALEVYCTEVTELEKEENTVSVEIQHVEQEVASEVSQEETVEQKDEEKNGIYVQNSMARLNEADILKEDLVVNMQDVELSKEALSEKKKVFSVTGDVTYTLYGQEYTENQSDMMLRVFAQVLKRHQDKVDTLPEQEGMNCAAKYENIEKPGTKEAKPSYFRVCANFEFDNGSAVCIGTAYGITDKMKKIVKLLEICGEDRSVFCSEQFELPNTKKNRVEYTFYGQKYSGDQTEMMCHVCSTVIAKHPEKLAELVENTLCIGYNDSSINRKSYFKVSRIYNVASREYRVGTSFGMRDKMKQIAKVFAICGVNNNVLYVEDYEFEIKNVMKKASDTKLPKTRKEKKDFMV